MICRPCRTSADKGIQGEEAHRAAGCKGDCDCMHRQGAAETMYNPATVKDMRDYEVGQQGVPSGPEGQSTRTSGV